jgi:uncharacterized protein
VNTAPWLEQRGEELRLRLHVQPRASRTAVAGTHGDRLKLRLHAPPQDGAANDELTAFLAEAFGVPRTQVALISGHAHRDKTVSIRRPTRLPVWLPSSGTQ